MLTSRRQFISQSAVFGTGLLGTTLMPERAAAMKLLPQPDAALNRVGASVSRFYRYSPVDNSQTDCAAWVQIDLGISRTINAIRLHPVKGPTPPECDCPVQFRVTCSDDLSFDNTTLIVGWQAKNLSAPANFLARFAPNPVTARYLRLEATPVVPAISSDSGAEPAILLPAGNPKIGNENAGRTFRLTEIEILSGKDVVSVGVRAASVLHSRLQSASDWV